ncbi:hypothetical protein [Nocardia donostiensis]|nr:hypothetical protein [Nocardia donostiensis]
MVTRAVLVEVFGASGRFDIDGALHQFQLAGLVSTTPEAMPAEAAISRVRDYITGRELDTTGYPLSELVAERFSVGWMVYAPVPEGEIAIGRAVFYVDDDGVLEHSTSSVAPATVIAEFERAFAERNGLEKVPPPRTMTDIQRPREFGMCLLVLEVRFVHTCVAQDARQGSGVHRGLRPLIGVAPGRGKQLVVPRVARS